LVRADLSQNAWLTRALRQFRSPTRGGFPDPKARLWGSATYWSFARLDRDRQVVEHAGKHGHVALIDIDGDTKNLATASAQELAAEGKFDAEVMMLRLYDRCWIYHDTDGDGAADLVTFTRDVKKLTADSAFRLDPSGHVVTIASAAKGMLRTDEVGARGTTAYGLRVLFERVMLH
jgi:hypothetical protein